MQRTPPIVFYYQISHIGESLQSIISMAGSLTVLL